MSWKKANEWRHIRNDIIRFRNLQEKKLLKKKKREKRKKEKNRNYGKNEWRKILKLSDEYNIA